MFIECYLHEGNRGTGKGRPFIHQLPAIGKSEIVKRAGFSSGIGIKRGRRKFGRHTWQVEATSAWKKRTLWG